MSELPPVLHIIVVLPPAEPLAQLPPLDDDEAEWLEACPEDRRYNWGNTALRAEAQAQKWDR